jgi:hypothetical protein
LEHLVRDDFLVVVSDRVKRQHARAVRGLPPKQVIRERDRRIIPFDLPFQFMGHEIIDPALAIDLGHVPVEPKHIRQPAHVDIHAEVVLEKTLRVKVLAHQRLAIGNVGVVLDPLATNNFPLA